MKKRVPGNLSEVVKYKERISIKNRQLRVLKELALMLSKTEDEGSFVRKAVPFIKQTLDNGDNLIIYVEIGSELPTVMGLDAEALKSIFAHLKDVITPRNSPVVVDLASEEEGDPLGFYNSQGYAKCIMAPISHRSNVMGFLAIPKYADFELQEDEKIFIKYLGEIIGVFFEYIYLRRDLQETKSEMEHQFQDLHAVYTVSKSLGGHLDTKAILDNALDTILAQDVLNIQAKGGIFLLNEETQLLELICFRNIGKYLSEREKTIELGHCLCGRVGQTGEMITSLSCSTDKRHETQYEGMTLHGHIILPLKTGERILGVLFLYLPPDFEPTTNQLKLLTAIANQLSVALENARLYERVRHLSVHDPLTNLYNRKVLLNRLDEEISRSARMDKPLSLAMIDIDHFKKINDTHGHMAGDRILQQLAKLLKNGVRMIDVVARFGGEEFTILLPGADMEQAVVIMERLRSAIGGYPFPIDEQGNTTSVTISVGISTLSSLETQNQSVLIKAADDALYQAKETGRNRICRS